MIQIDKGIPIPNRFKYPFKDMEIGDSFYLTKEEKTYNIHKLAKKAGIKVLTRRENDGRRIWRIA